MLQHRNHRESSLFPDPATERITNARIRGHDHRDHPCLGKADRSYQGNLCDGWLGGQA